MVFVHAYVNLPEGKKLRCLEPSTDPGPKNIFPPRDARNVGVPQSPTWSDATVLDG